MVNELYTLFGVTPSDVAFDVMSQNATVFGVSAIIASAVIVAILLGAMLWRRR